jgi:opacity protein-like surface antigen
MMHLTLSAAVVVVASMGAPAFADGTPLTEAEKAAGWKVLFDGASAGAFKGYKSADGKMPTKGWEVKDGELRSLKGGGGGDLVTNDQFEDFEFSLEFKCAAGANSGIMYRVADGKDYTWQTGPEFQLLDDEKHADGKDPKHRAGSLYDMIAPPPTEPGKERLAPAEKWNTARIRLSGGLLQHYLNGVKTAETRVDGPEWKAMIAGSKFKDMKGFGVQPAGRIALQDHGDEVAFRNIRVRDLKAKMPGEIGLFNGKDFAGWTWFCNDEGKSKLADVWSMKDGLVSDAGTPNGYLATTSEHTSYVLRVSWRWEAPPAKAANSGVLLRVQKKDEVWPKSIEAQLMAGNAGDFYSIGSFPMKGDAARSKGRHVAHTKGNERPQGEWNEYEIIVDGGTIVLNVNGEELNRATECEVVPGRIALQSEGGQIYFKDVRMAPLGK